MLKTKKKTFAEYCFELVKHQNYQSFNEGLTAVLFSSGECLQLEKSHISLFVFCLFSQIIIMYKWLSLTIFLKYILECNYKAIEILPWITTGIFMFDYLMHFDMLLV